MKTTEPRRSWPFGDLEPTPRLERFGRHTLTHSSECECDECEFHQTSPDECRCWECAERIAEEAEAEADRREDR